jgi:hypothetical protein
MRTLHVLDVRRVKPLAGNLWALYWPIAFSAATFRSGALGRVMISTAQHGLGANAIGLRRNPRAS